MTKLRKVSVVLIVLLAFSVGVNAYFFRLVVSWQEAWFQQALTTYNIERLYRESGADVSYSAVQEKSKDLFYDYELSSLLNSEGSWFSGFDETVIVVDGTRLYFKEGEFAGSKANLPDGLNHWGFGRE